MNVVQEALFLQLWDKLGFYSQFFYTQKCLCTIAKGELSSPPFSLFFPPCGRRVSVCVCVFAPVVGENTWGGFGVSS